MLFKNRFDAGEKLAVKLKNYKKAVLFAIPRGGVEVAYPIAKQLKCPLHVIVARKIATPQSPEAGIGAVTADGTTVLNSGYIEMPGFSKKGVNMMKKEALKEAIRRDKIYGTGKQVSVKDKTAILVDDGLATGHTMLAAIKSVKKSKPEKIIVAVPIASKNAYEMIKKECDEIVCLHVSEILAFSVGGFYEEFHQLTDEEVVELLRKANEKIEMTE